MGVGVLVPPALHTMVNEWKCLSIASFCFVFKNFLGPLMDILKEHITSLEKDQLTAHQSELTAFFIKALDFRAEHSQVTHLCGRSRDIQVLSKTSAYILIVLTTEIVSGITHRLFKSCNRCGFE